MKVDEASRRYFGVKCDGGTRPENFIKTVVIHQTAGSFNSASGVASYLKNRPDGSVHLVVDDNSTYVLASDRTVTCGAAGYNEEALHIELAGPAPGPVAAWLKHTATINRAAYATARWLNRHDLPYAYRSAKDLRRGKHKGWTQHRNITLSGIATTTHTDALRRGALVKFKVLLRFWQKKLDGKAPKWRHNA